MNLLQKLIHNRKTHWERAYKNQSSHKLSWYQDYPEISLRLIASTKVAAESNIIDIGGGASKLVDFLLQQGYKNITVLDIAGNSIEKAKLRLGGKANNVKWIETDITNCNLEIQYDIWHDRAVFHFLTNSQDRKRYIKTLKQSLKPNGNVIIATFSLSGPKKCSGLKIARYSPESLLGELGNDFKIIETIDEVHITPANAKQNFIYCHFRKRA
ncbi:MAG: class I SAM-dependent methyltransferase [Omnitrophica bacterium]|nr:class I SAM-dependent methyltransferase [Candidatus Omnitrophota bacterium]